jgi:hypothetical protein
MSRLWSLRVAPCRSDDQRCPKCRRQPETETKKRDVSLSPQQTTDHKAEEFCWWIFVADENDGFELGRILERVGYDSLSSKQRTRCGARVHAMK